MTFLKKTGKNIKSIAKRMAVYFCMTLQLIIYNQCLSNGQPIDFSKEKYWIALPNRVDVADAVPNKTDLHNRQDSAIADVFYIHPTTLYKKRHKNDNLRIPSSKRIAKAVTMNQASLFNGSCKVYAPRYRQANLSVQLGNDSLNKLAALDFAYKDVKAAFDYYLSNNNGGRPIVIAGHSQGSYHAIRLLYDFFEGKPLLKQLVVAYISGLAITQMQMDSMFKTISYSSNASQTKCIVSWQTLGENAKADYFKKEAWSFVNGKHTSVNGLKRLCTNPLSWDTTATNTAKNLHLGSVKMGNTRKSLKVVMPNYLQCRIDDGFVIISPPKGTLFNAPEKNYHIYDYNLFYLNIRQNVSDRVAAFISEAN